MIWLWALTAQATIVTEAPPAVGTEVVVTVLDASDSPRVGRTVSVVHRPDLDGERELAIGITDARGRVRWTPEIPGVATVQVDGETLDLAVAWPGVPTGTATLLGLLGTAGIGGIFFGLFRRRRR